LSLSTESVTAAPISTPAHLLVHHTDDPTYVHSVLTAGNLSPERAEMDQFLKEITKPCRPHQTLHADFFHADTGMASLLSQMY
jgi:hypothetical protein